MAITQHPLGSVGINADDDIYTSTQGVPSISPTASRLVLAWVGSTRNGATPSQPTVTGNGLTWVAVASITGNTEGTPRSRLTLFRAMGGSPSAGSPTITFSETQQNCVLSFLELAGIATGGTHGSGAIVQAVTDAADAVQAVPLTLSAFGSATNGAIYGVLKDTTSAVTAESGWTEVHEVGSTSPALRLETSWRATADATVAGSSWSPSANADAMAIGVEIAEFVGAFTLAADPGSYTLTGSAAGLLTTRLLSAAAGAYSLTGSDAALLYGRLLAAEAGAYALTGAAASLLATRLLSAEAGSYALTGADAALLVGRLLSAAAGAYTLTGADADLIFVGAGAFTLSADPGSYTISGAAASLLAGRLLSADPGSYALTGSEASLLAGRLLSADPGAYVLTGSDALLLVGRLLSADPGSYAMDGSTAGLLAARVLLAAPGAYVVTGASATLVVGIAAGLLVPTPGTVRALSPQRTVGFPPTRTTRLVDN